MEESLEFDGVRYISSKRAASLVGYTKDYVGQLCRAGKVRARLVGRSWYVSEESIRQHKLGVHYTLHQPTKKRSQVERQAAPARAAHDSDENVVIVKAKDPEAVATGIVDAHDTPDDDDDDSEVQVTSALVPDEGAHTLSSNDSGMIPAAKSSLLQKRVLAESDVHFHDASPLYFEDSRPLNPEPVRVQRFQNVPIASPRMNRPIRTHDVPQASGTMRAPAAGMLDGVRKAAGGAKNVERYAPGARVGKQVGGVPTSTSAESTAVRQPAAGASHMSANDSKTGPVLGAVILLCAVLVAYLLVG